MAPEAPRREGRKPSARVYSVYCFEKLLINLNHAREGAVYKSKLSFNTFPRPFVIPLGKQDDKFSAIVQSVH